MKKRKVWRVLLSVLLGLTVLFIWSNSLRGREASSEQSGWVLQFLQGILDGLGISLSLTVHFVRKAAHFTEYFLLGVQAALYGCVVTGVNRRRVWDMCCAIGGVAFLDETIQIFSQRGPAIADVWLDMAGGAVGLILCFALYFLIVSCRRKKRRG